MEKLNMSKADIIKAFKEGKTIRKTSGVWNRPEASGVIISDVSQLERFYDWAYLVDVYKSDTPNIDYDLIGASGGDMF